MLPTQVTIGGIMLDDAGRTVTVDGEPVALTPTEFDILRLLMQHHETMVYQREHNRVLQPALILCFGEIES